MDRRRRSSSAARILAVVFLAGGLVVTLLHGRIRYLLILVLAGAVAGGVAYLLDRFAPEPAASVVDSRRHVRRAERRRVPERARARRGRAIVTASAPWLTRRWRRLGWVLVFALAFDRFVTARMSFDTVRAVLVGWVVGAAVVVLLGGPSRRPTGHGDRRRPRPRRRAARPAGSRERRRPRLDAVLRARRPTGRSCS